MSTLAPLSVFISYARSDGLEAATHLLSELMRNQVSTWLDGRDLDPFHDFTAEIEDAIERASHVAVCITEGSKRNDSFVRREINYAISERKPIIPLRFADITPHVQITTIPFIDLFRDWESGFDQFLTRLRRPPQDQEFATPEFDPFRQHLERLNDYILDELRRTLLNPEGVLQLRTSGVGHARFRTLPIAYRSSRPSWFWADEQREQEFASFAQAFKQHGRRVVLLGEPGAGKTTTLLAFAREAVSSRLADPSALLPVYVPIRTWDGTGDLVAWMAAVADLDAATLRTAVVSGQVLLLLDGLDELRRISVRAGASEDPRLAFLRAATTLGRTPMVIACRRAEYEQMAASSATRVGLEAVIRLLPLTDGQISQYLSKGPQLLATLRSDDTLRGMARNPLIMTLLAMAYHDEGLKADDLNDPAYSLAEVRSRIFSKFVARRYEFEIARLGEGIKPPFTLDEVYEGLGAVAMDLLDQFQRVTIEIDESGYSYGRTPAEGEPVDLVEIDIRSFRRRLGPAALSFLALAGRLDVVVPARRGTVRFTHLLMRDHFAFAEASKRLQESDPDVRRGAVGVLGLMGDRRALPQLFRALEDPDETVRAVAVSALGEVGDPASLEALLAALQGMEPGLHAEFTVSLAIEALGRLGDRAIEPLRRLLKSERKAFGAMVGSTADLEVKRAAVQALGHIGAAAVPTLIDALEDIEVRADALSALGASRDPAAFDPLISAVESRNSLEGSYVLAGKAVQALGSLGDPRAIPFLLAVEGLDQYRALDAIASIGGPEAVHSLLAALQDRLPERRSRAALALGRLEGAQVTTQLEATLDDPDLEVRLAAATSLERLGFDPAALRSKRPPTAELLTALVHAAPIIRAEAAHQLGKRHDPQVADALAGAMGDVDAAVAQAAQMALASLGDSRAVGPLGERLFTFGNWVTDAFLTAIGSLGSSWTVEPPSERLFRWSARATNAVERDVAEALGKIPDAESARLLIDALDDEDDSAYPSVVSALVALGEAAVSPLLEVLREPDPRFRSIVGSVLAGIGAPAVPPLLHLLRSEDPLMEVAASVLSRIGAAAVPGLLDAVSDPSPIVQALAALSLGATGDDRAARPLVSLLDQANEDVRTTAATALAELGEGAVMPLAEALHSVSPTARSEAATALGEIGAGEALQPLLEVLTDPEPLVRRNAITALPLLHEPGIEPRMRLLLDDPHLGVRLAGLKAFEGNMDEELLAGRRPSADELLRALDDPDPQLRADVIPWLATTIRDESSARAAGQERLSSALADRNGGVQLSAARHLALLGVVDPLLEGLQAPDEPTRMACATALMTTGEAVPEPLRLLLHHDQPVTRRWAAKVLGARHDAQAVPGLIALLLDKDIDVADEATNALVAMPEHSGETLLGLIADDRLGPHAAEAFRRMGEVAVWPLIWLLAAEDEQVRAHAVAILVAIGRPAVKLLIGTLNSRAASGKTLRIGAAEALDRIGHRRGLAALKAEHNEAWLAAVRALGVVIRTASRLYGALEGGRAIARRVIRRG
jgi:HEAT repeat protein